MRFFIYLAEAIPDNLAWHHDGVVIMAKFIHSGSLFDAAIQYAPDFQA